MQVFLSSVSVAGFMSSSFPQESVLLNGVIHVCQSKYLNQHDKQNWIQPQQSACLRTDVLFCLMIAVILRPCNQLCCSTYYSRIGW